MIRSDAEKLKKREEIAAMKELKTYMVELPEAQCDGGDGGVGEG